MDKTLFFGNGINRVTPGAKSWNDILNEIKKESGINFENGNVPYTYIYERLVLEKSNKPVSNFKTLEHKIKNRIAEETKYTNNILHDRMAQLGFKNYITTNYDYSFQEHYGIDSFKISNTETKYSLHRYYEHYQHKFKIWMVHGEFNRVGSMMLGLEHYGDYLSQINTHLKNIFIPPNYPKKMDKAELEKFEIQMKEHLVQKERYFKEKNNFEYWIDLFFLTDVHIVGFGLDYSEIDLWWLLNQRARLIKLGEPIKNKITFYQAGIESEKKGLLNSLAVTVPTTKSVLHNDWEVHYRDILNEIDQSHRE